MRRALLYSYSTSIHTSHFKTTASAQCGTQITFSYSIRIKSSLEVIKGSGMDIARGMFQRAATGIAEATI